MVRTDDLRAGDAALPGLQDIRNGRRVKRGKLIDRRVLHRTTLALDERGTEASAATAAIMATRAAPAEEEASFEMRVDRPFALAVLHRGTGAVLFTAWVDDPTDGER